MGVTKVTEQPKEITTKNCCYTFSDYTFIAKIAFSYLTVSPARVSAGMPLERGDVLRALGSIALNSTLPQIVLVAKITMQSTKLTRSLFSADKDISTRDVVLLGSDMAMLGASVYGGAPLLIIALVSKACIEIGDGAHQIYQSWDHASDKKLLMCASIMQIGIGVFKLQNAYQIALPMPMCAKPAQPASLIPLA